MSATTITITIDQTSATFTSTKTGAHTIYRTSETATEWARRVQSHRDGFLFVQPVDAVILDDRADLSEPVNVMAFCDREGMRLLRSAAIQKNPRRTWGAFRRGLYRRTRAVFPQFSMSARLQIVRDLLDLVDLSKHAGKLTIG